MYKQKLVSAIFTLTAILVVMVTFAITHVYAASSIASRVKGWIVLQVEENGEAWYINLSDLNRYYLGTPDMAFDVMRQFGIGITSIDLAKVPIGLITDANTDSDKDGLNDDLEKALGTDPNKSDTDNDGYNDKSEIQKNYNPNGLGSPNYDSSFAKINTGKIFLQIEDKGQAWYINPVDMKRYFLNRPSDAFSIMRMFGLGITNVDLDKIDVGSMAQNSTNKKCGDDICDAIEKSNTLLCPKDCISLSNNQTEFLNLKYSSIDSDAVKLDLYLPSDTCTGKLPLVVNIHGGAFKTGDKKSPKNMFLTDHCYALASVNYRLSGEAVFPAGAQDVKAAVRWLRANADKYNLDSDHFGVIGGSAGGYYAAFLGTTGDVKSFDVGDNLSYSSAVQAVVDEFGPTDLTSLASDRVDAGVPLITAESEFIGCDISLASCIKAATASPINYVSMGDSPFYILHGAKDTTVPIAQSQNFYNALQKAGVTASFTILPNAGHGAPEFDNYESQIVDFFDKYLKK